MSNTYNDPDATKTKNTRSPDVTGPVETGVDRNTDTTQVVAERDKDTHEKRESESLISTAFEVAKSAGQRVKEVFTGATEPRDKDIDRNAEAGKENIDYGKEKVKDVADKTKDKADEAAYSAKEKIDYGKEKAKDNLSRDRDFDESAKQKKMDENKEKVKDTAYDIKEKAKDTGRDIKEKNKRYCS
jgi:hypothetical protein